MDIQKEILADVIKTFQDVHAMQVNLIFKCMPFVPAAVNTDIIYSLEEIQRIVNELTLKINEAIKEKSEAKG